jgi:hypothetical protein
MADTTNITKWLWVFKAVSGTYPLPDSYIFINAGTWYVTYQWNAWKNVLNMLKMSEAKDNLDSAYYSYSTDDTKSFYSVWWFLENVPTSMRNMINPFQNMDSLNSANAADYSKRYLLLRWDWVWILTESWTNVPVEQLYAANYTINLASESKSLNLNLSSTNTISWTWLILWVIQSAQSWNFSYNAPASCPTWFISVPWNSDFSQPGFCVAKYEMTYSDADTPNSTAWSRNTVIGIDWKIPSSMPNKFPISNMTQQQAINSCKLIWAHLITNNEWMTIARNLESNKNNWSSGQVWSWWIYRWISWEANTNVSLWCITSASSWSWSRPFAAKPLIWDTSKFWILKQNDCDSKRQLELSNWPIIWDFAWNVWEHVNKANTINWDFYGSWNISFWITTWSTWYEWDSTNSEIDSNERKLYWATSSAYNWNNTWIWKIVSMIWAPTGNVFVRSWNAADNVDSGAGIYTLALQWWPTDAAEYIGFRCVK